MCGWLICLKPRSLVFWRLNEDSFIQGLILIHFLSILSIINRIKNWLATKSSHSSLIVLKISRPASNTFKWKAYFIVIKCCSICMVCRGGVGRRRAEYHSLLGQIAKDWFLIAASSLVVLLLSWLGYVVALCIWYLVVVFVHWSLVERLLWRLERVVQVQAAAVIVSVFV